jgi:hypothetical protein
VSLAAINTAKRNPSSSGDQRECEKKRCARQWCHTAESRQPTSIPVTVRNPV